MRTLTESPAPSSRTGLPVWVRVADAATLLLVVLAAIVAEGGGFRTHLLGVRLAVTSPLRTLVLALVVAAVRHALVPRQPIYRAIPGQFGAWRREPSVRAAAAALIATRPTILAVGLLAVATFGYAGGEPPYRVSSNELANLPVRWDAGWYLGIATHGYRYTPNQPRRQQNIVFFPAYPTLVRGVGRLFGRSPGAFVWGGMGVSLLAFFGALVYLYAFARDRLPDDEARYALWAVAAYPFALFYFAVYTESLYLLAAVAIFYHFERREYWRAAAWGLLAGLTRPNGCFISVALAVLAVSPWLPQWLAGGAPGPGGSRDRRLTMTAILFAAAPGVGVLIYTFFIWRITGNPLAWAAGHEAWGRTYNGLTVLVTERYDWIANLGVSGYMSRLPVDFLNATGVAFALAAVWPVARRLGLAYAVFILVNMLPPLAEGGLLSAGRFSSVMFPAFVWFASAVPARHRVGWVATFAAFQALNAALFFTWRPLF
ncbi:MAG: mannosyltransferase family protein [Betaproteobacteria bacterium]